MDTRREAIRENCRGMEEQLDKTPVEIPGVNMRPLTLREEMQRFVRTELSRGAESSGYGSFEEEDDFSIENEDADLVTPYTVRELVNDIQPADELEGEANEEDIEAGKEVSTNAEQGVPENKASMLSESQTKENSKTAPQFTDEELAKLRAFLNPVEN